MTAKLRNILLSCAVVVISWSSPRALAALVDLELVITPLIGSFQYDVTVRNNSLVDLALVTIIDAPIADPLIDPSLTAPVGFLALYDSGLGFIDFLEDTSTFGAGQTVTGFRFNSGFLPGPSRYTTFDTLDVNGGSFRGSIVVIGGPVASAPDSGSTLLLGAFIALAFAFCRVFWHLRPAPCRAD
jgi:hypothetical protein